MTMLKKSKEQDKTTKQTTINMGNFFQWLKAIDFFFFFSLRIFFKNQS